MPYRVAPVRKMPIVDTEKVRSRKRCMSMSGSSAFVDRSTKEGVDQHDATDQTVPHAGAMKSAHGPDLGKAIDDERQTGREQ